MTAAAEQGAQQAAEQSEMLRLFVDGEEYRVARGQSILQALDSIGVLMKEVEIPHYCWHPKLSLDASCRLCQVEVEGPQHLVLDLDEFRARFESEFGFSF